MAQEEHWQLGGVFGGAEQDIPYGKPIRLANWHPTTIPEHESPFRLGYCLPQREYALFRHGESSILTCRVWEDDVRLGCTYIDNSAIRELYWWSNASPSWLRWVVRLWDGWKRRTA